MFIAKKKYYFIIENTKYLDLNLIKIRNKFNIIYRNIETKEKFQNVEIFRKECKKKGINFYVSNDAKLLVKLKADGLYISAFNKNLKLNYYKVLGYKIIGSAHNQRELNIKSKQGCNEIIFSRIFKTSYKEKKGFLGLYKFNMISLNSKIPIVPLGGIKETNIRKIVMVRCSAFACLSALKKKPANIINRLF